MSFLKWWTKHFLKLFSFHCKYWNKYGKINFTTISIDQKQNHISNQNQNKWILINLLSSIAYNEKFWINITKYIIIRSYLNNQITCDHTKIWYGVKKMQ